MNERSIVAVFDFDGTITTIDTFRDFIVWHLGPFRFWIGMLATSPLIILYAMGFISNDIPKHVLFKLLYRNYPEVAFRAACEHYARRRLPSLIRPKALSKICYHLGEKHRVLIASASLIDWIEPWASSIGFESVIATRALIRNDRLTGDFADVCCYGHLKVVRRKEFGVSLDNSIIYAYGDSKGDSELLAYADYSFYREF